MISSNLKYPKGPISRYYHSAGWGFNIEIWGHANIQYIAHSLTSDEASEIVDWFMDSTHSQGYGQEMLCEFSLPKSMAYKLL